MKKSGKAVILAAAAAFMAVGTVSTVKAAGENAGGPGERFAIEEMEISEEADKIVLAVGQGDSKVKVSYYEKNSQGTWSQLFDTEGVYGRNGGTYDKREGDGMTPYGIYKINKAFGIQDDPGSLLPYEKLKENDYWVDDPESRHYNRMVNTDSVEKDWNSAEHLIQVSPYYNYVLSLDYNEEAIPGKGSAIFIHCTAEGYTGSSGCICIGEDEMKLLVTRADDGMRAVIVPDEEALKKQ